MAIRVYRLAVVGCPRRVIEPIVPSSDDEDAAASGSSFSGVGKSCLCNRFVKPEAYTETHDSTVTVKKWVDDPAIGEDHFLYWGATTRHLQDGSKARFQVVEQTEFYDKETSIPGEELQSHPSDAGYLERAAAVRISTSAIGKVAVRLKAEQASARAGGIRSTTQIFPNEDFGGKNGGVLGFACVFDPTLHDEQMRRQIQYLTELLLALSKRKKKLAVVCTKCDTASEERVRLGASLAACALKKPIPFFETSARDDVNVEDVFFTLIGHARKSPKLARIKSPKSTRHSSLSAGHLSYKEAVSLKKKDIHRAKDAYRKLLQKKITSFSSVWSETYLMLEKEEEFSDLLQLAGQEEGKEMVKNMFCLRLIEIKLTEGSKVFGMSSATKKLNKEKSLEYQRYLSEALKSHPDLRDESVYEYVYSTGMVEATPTSSSHTHQTSISSDNTSSSLSQCVTPDNPLPIGGSISNLPEVSPTRSSTGHHPYSIAMPDFSLPGSTANGNPVGLSHSIDVLSASQSPAVTLSPLTQTRPSSVYTLGFTPKHMKNGTASIAEGDTSMSHSHPILDITPPPPPPPLLLTAQRPGLERKRSNSMGRLETSPSRTLSSKQSNDSVDALNAEPYLQPMEIQIVMHTLPRSHRIPESTSIQSLHGVESPRRKLPAQHSSVEISDYFFRSPLGQTPSKGLGHRRTASNPWLLEGARSNTLTPPLPPPVPARDYQRPSMSPPLLGTSLTQGLNESSLDFPHENRRSILSASLSPNQSTSALDRPQSHYDDIDETDKLSTISGPFEEISDDPDSSNEAAAAKKPDTAAESPQPITPSQAKLVKKKSSTLNSDYEKIEEYITMAPSSTFPRRPLVTPEASPKRTNSGERIPKTTGAGPQQQQQQQQQSKKKGWTRQTTDSVIPDAATIRSSSPPLFPTRRFTMFDNPTSSSNIRPLPPSPTKRVTTTSSSVSSPQKKSGIGRHISNGSNIYETIDEELLNRVTPRRRGSGLPKWAPPVDPKHYVQYMVILRRFFTDPKVVEAWEKTVQEIIPGGDVSTYPPPYSSLSAKQSHQLGPTVEVPSPTDGSEGRGGGAAGGPPKSAQLPHHARAGSHDQYVLPLSLTQPQSSSTPATPAVPRPRSETVAGGKRVGFSDPRHGFVTKRVPSRENLIEMLNMSMFNQGDSSESESSDSEESEEEDEGEEDEVEEEEEEEEVEEEEEEDDEEEEEVVVEEEREIEKAEVKTKEDDERKAIEKDEEEEIIEEKREVQNVPQLQHQTKIEDEEINEDRVHSPSQTIAELDSILISLNPILSTFSSVLGNHDDPPASNTEPLQEKTAPQLQTLVPLDSTAPPSEHNPILRASVSTDSDLDSTSSPLIKPSAIFPKRIQPSGPGGGGGGSRVLKWVNAFELEDNSRTGKNGQGKRGPPPPVPKRKPTRKRDVVTTTTDGMSDSGISNCHSQTFDDGFNPLETT